jgi:hypothetical protein
MIEDTVVERVPHTAQLKEGVYDGVVLRVEAQNGVQTSYGIKDMLVLTFEVKGVEVRRRYNKSWNKGSNLYKLVSDLRPGEVLGTKYDVAQLEGTKVRVMIGHHKTETGDVWDNVMQVGLPETPTEELPTLAELAEAGGLDEVSSFKVKRGPDPEGEE